MVDVVYTWVDGDRPGFAKDLAAAREAHVRETGQAPDVRALSANRFRDNDCLRHSLRSLARYAPWVDRIHLVTAGERPAWLDASHPAIRFVRHDEIFPDGAALPTFNSLAIEACLHRISGLSDRFLYFNDDFFLMDDLDLDYFTTPDAAPRFSFETWQMFSNLADPSPIGASAAYCRQLLDARFGRRPIRLEIPHEPILLDRAVLRALEGEWPDEMARTRRNRFRTGREFVVARIYVHYRLELALAEAGKGGKPVECHPTRAGFVRFGLQSPDLATQLRKVVDAGPPFLCINDEAGEEEPRTAAQIRQDLQILQTFFRQRFPDRAPWENDVPALA